MDPLAQTSQLLLRFVAVARGAVSVQLAGRPLEQMPALLDRAAQLETLGGRPLGVVTAATGSQPGWTRHQRDLATLSSSSFHRTVAGSTHQSLIDDPKDATASSGAIRDVVVAVRDREGA